MAFLCKIFGTLNSMNGTPLVGAKITATSQSCYFSGPNYIVPKREMATTDANGYFEMTLVETETSNRKVNFELEYMEPAGKMVLIFDSVLIPHKTQIDIKNLLIYRGIRETPYLNP